MAAAQHVVPLLSSGNGGGCDADLFYGADERSLKAMPIYRPIDSGISMKVSSSTLERLVMHRRALEADFAIPEDGSRRLRVSFIDVEVTRTLDEMALSTEDDEKWVGLVPEHFAYEITNAHFWRSQFSALKLSMPNLKHYRFVTGWTCLDVISEYAPTFSIVKGE